MAVRPAGGIESRGSNRFEVLSLGAVVEEFWRGGRIVAEIHRDGVAVGRSDHGAISAQLESLPVSTLKNRIEICSSQRLAMCVEGVEEPLDGSPALPVEGDTKLLGAVPEHEAQELALAYESVIHRENLTAVNVTSKSSGRAALP